MAGRADRYDDIIMDAVHRIDNPPMHAAMDAVTQLGSHAAIGSAAGITALAMWQQGRREDAWTVVVSTGGAMAINTLLKNIFQRQRPIERARRITLPNSHSFPERTLAALRGDVSDRRAPLRAAPLRRHAGGRAHAGRR